MTDRDLAFEAEAVALSRAGSPSPNPPVGAVVVRDGAVVGRGYHRRAGEAHAEVAALEDAGARARGATVYVTLEPCNHHGRTPPCTEALVRAGVQRVVYANPDPNPHVAGGGRRRLEAAGIEVAQGFAAPWQSQAERDLAPWRTFITAGRAFVTLKVGMSLDARIATSTRESRWITGPAARADVHALRASVDAVMVGSGTARADDPMLTARDVNATRQPARVVVDGSLSLRLDAALVRTAREVPTWVLCAAPFALGESAEALRARGVEVIPVPGTRHVELGAALAALATRGVVSVLCEGGGGLHGALLDADLCDRLVAYVAPMLLGPDGVPAFGVTSPAKLADAVRLRLVDARALGDDLRVEMDRG